MSYYRWSSSNWYAFWCTSDTEEIQEEILALWWGIDEDQMVNIPRKDLPMPVFENVDIWLDSTFSSWYNDMSLRDKHEAMIAITEFLEDTENHYAEKIRDRIDSLDDGLCGTERGTEVDNI